MPGLGMVNEVVPEMFETVALMTREPGTRDPPAAAAGTVMLTVKAPVVSVAGAGIGKALAAPKVRPERLVWLGKLLPVIVTRVPVEPEVGDTVTVPAVIDRVFVFVLFACIPIWRRGWGRVPGDASVVGHELGGAGRAQPPRTVYR